MKKVIITITVLVIGALVYSFTSNNNSKGLASMKADHIAIGVIDFEENIAFYKDKLGFKEEVRWQVEGLPNLHFAYLANGDSRIEIIGDATREKNNTEPSSFGEHLSQQGYVHLCFQVDDIDKTFKELNAKGVKTFIKHGSYPLNTTHRRSVGFIKDPSGNVIEFANHLKEENK